MNIIFKRKSVRTFLDIDVDDTTIEQIIRAGMAAPSVKTSAPGNFMWFVIRKPGKSWPSALPMQDL